MTRHLPFPGFLAALALLCPPGLRAARLSLVIDSKPGEQKLVEALERDLGPGNTIQVFDVRAVDLSNPVDKGRFLARISNADVVVPVGDPASRLVADELEDFKTFFIAAGGLSGEVLGRRQVAGILSYSPEETVRVAKILLPRIKDIGVLFTPGYEGVVLRMQSAAAGEGMTITSYRVKSRQDVGPAVREAATRSDLVWTVGDPLFTQDLVFAYLLQESFVLKKPLAAPIPALVERGGLFCTVPDGDKMARQASESLARLLSPDGRAPGDRVQSAPDGGSVLLNRRLAEKWDIHAPPSLRLGNKNAP